ncbi:alpha-galactosidase [Parvularcula sp. IMCC14364]|uniref:alpha-galactosidase n=1 Tax=Parvularcula sp. IMCC14364 TaxID=3067902 RepID=UPI0027405953|nr:alpha-galactosidase [Parvularcula sp. IMCC14364]
MQHPRSSQEAIWHEISGSDIRCLLVQRGDNLPELVYLGPADTCPKRILPDVPVRPASPDIPVPHSVFPQHGRGFAGEPAISGMFGKGPWETKFQVSKFEATETSVTFYCQDALKKLSLNLTFSLCPESGVLSSETILLNDSDHDYTLSNMAALCLPLPVWASEAHLFRGNWADEGHLDRVPLFCGKIERTSRQGRPGFDWPQFAILSEAETTDQSGKALAVHLGWSGNHQLSIEQNGHGEAQLQLSEWLAPGEVGLRPGDSYKSPTAYTACSYRGLNEIRKRYHKFLRKVNNQIPRPVHLNTWEGVYFDVDEHSVIELAQAAAKIGVERFILDDGWFTGRENDETSLGDWQPDPVRFPNGLAPVVEAVNDAGMSFGLWVEPEMINPDSKLYREHPDWAIQATGYEQVTGRNQLVLDLTNPDVEQFILTFLSGLLDTLNIEYLKWDYNRALYPGSTNDGPVYHRQTLALYRILAQLKANHPAVTIESCSSGGGRIDFGILEYTDRVWPSDNTDALERVRIQRNLSLFLPPEIMGCHAGPAPYGMTGRDLPMSFRCLVALFGHFGAELDPRKLSQTDAATFLQYAELYKKYRPLIHTGQLACIYIGENIDAQIITYEKNGTALLRLLNTNPQDFYLPVSFEELTGWSSATATHLLSTKEDTSYPAGTITLPCGPSGCLYFIERTSHGK